MILNYGLPQWLSGKESSCNAGDVGWIPGLGRSPRGGDDSHGNPLQYSCLGNSMDRGAWWATVHEITKESDTTEWLNTHAYVHMCVYIYIERECVCASN